MDKTPMFDFFAKEEAVAAVAKQQSDLEQRIEKHRQSLKLCWPEWDGPKVDSKSVDGYCSVGDCIVYSITHGENRYYYMAPCRIVSISDDDLELEVEVEYEQGSVCEHYNGDRLKLHILEVWAPTRLLNEHCKF